MTAKSHEADDPYALVGQGFPVPSDYDSVGLMARTFVEEYAMIGFDRERVMRLFRSARYQGPHGVLRLRGEAYVKELLDSVFGSDEEVASRA